MNHSFELRNLYIVIKKEIFQLRHLVYQKLASKSV